MAGGIAIHRFGLFRKIGYGIWLIGSFFFSCLVPDTALTQDMSTYRFDRYNTENYKLVKGLSQNWVYCILQDRYGYMWFGTWDGLNKFDGYNFTVYNVADGLSNHSIFSMIEDEKGDFWLGTDKGLNKFDRKSQTFVRFENLPGDTSSLYKNRVNCLIQTADGTLWLGTGAGLASFDRETGKFTGYLSAAQEYTSPRSNYILHLLEDDDRKIWVSTTYGLIIFDPQTGRSTRYYHIPGDSTSLSDNNVRCVIQDRKGNFWIGTRKGLNYFDTTLQRNHQFLHDPANSASIGSDYIRTLYEDRLGKIWMGTDNGGLIFYDEPQKRFVRFTNNINDPNSLSNDKVYSIYEDRSGNLWIGTYNGVSKINKYSNNFGLVQQTLRTGSGYGLNSNFIWCFEEDFKGNLWIGSSGGINILDKSTGTYRYLTHQPDASNSLAANEVRSLQFDPTEKCMWIGLYGTGIDQYDLQTGHIMHFIPNPEKNSLSDSYVNDILLDHYGQLWIATGRGLNKFDPVTGTFAVFKHDIEDTNSISNSIVISLFRDQNNFLWIGTNNGLNQYIEKENRFVRYFHNQDYQVYDKPIFYITQDHSGMLWLGTSGGGLIKFNPESGIHKVYSTRDGLPNDIIYGIIPDAKNNLWLSCNRGLVKFYTADERIVNYDVKDGIQSYEFNLGSCYFDRKGIMYFGGMNGYNFFDPDNVAYNPNPPVVVLSAFRKFNELQKKEFIHHDTIILKYDENFFSFEISALDYTTPAKNKYQYRLEGVDKNWVRTDANERLAEYKNVKPGLYRFMAQGSNNDGIWSESELLLTVLIKPPWYGTWFFRIIFSLVIIGLVWYMIYRRIRNIKRKNEVDRKLLEIEKQKFDLEQKALRLQMNPHFIFNSLNSIQSYIVTHHTELAVTYLGKFSQLMRLILSNSGNDFVPFNEELKAIHYYLELEKLRFDNKFEYQVSVDSEIDAEYVEIPPMIIQPYIENAIIHGLLHKKEAGNLWVDFRFSNSNIYCTIRDDGVGREQAGKIREEQGIKRKSSGMIITQARLELISPERGNDFNVKVTDLTDEAGNASGTLVELLIPVHEE